jgi:hypothetical protein
LSNRIQFSAAKALRMSAKRLLWPSNKIKARAWACLAFSYQAWRSNSTCGPDRPQGGENASIDCLSENGVAPNSRGAIRLLDLARHDLHAPKPVSSRFSVNCAAISPMPISATVTKSDRTNRSEIVYQASLRSCAHLKWNFSARNRGATLP